MKGALLNWLRQIEKQYNLTPKPHNEVMGMENKDLKAYIEELESKCKRQKKPEPVKLEVRKVKPRKIPLSIVILTFNKLQPLLRTLTAYQPQLSVF